MKLVDGINCISSALDDCESSPDFERITLDVDALDVVFISIDSISSSGIGVHDASASHFSICSRVILTLLFRRSFGERLAPKADSVSTAGPNGGLWIDPHLPRVHFVSNGPQLCANVTLAMPKIFSDSSLLGSKFIEDFPEV